MSKPEGVDDIFDGAGGPVFEQVHRERSGPHLKRAKFPRIRPDADDETKSITLWVFSQTLMNLTGINLRPAGQFESVTSSNQGRDSSLAGVGEHSNVTRPHLIFGRAGVPAANTRSSTRMLSYLMIPRDEFAMKVTKVSTSGGVRGARADLLDRLRHVQIPPVEETITFLQVHQLVRW